MPTPKNLPDLTLIVAATLQNGIGKNGTLPWPMLKKEMAYFARVTKRVMPEHQESPASSASATQPKPTTPAEPTTPARQNVVLMGRKTYASIPPHLRPLRNRTNIVISSQARSELSDLIPEDRHDVLLASDIPSALRLLQTSSSNGSIPPLGRVFVIGGAKIYEQVLRLQEARRVLLTRVQGEWECDTFFPELRAEEGWVKRERGELEEFVGEEVKEGGEVEQGVGFEMGMWERV